MTTPSYDAKSIRAVLEDYGFEIYSIRKKRRSEGGVRYNFQRRLRDQTSCKGTPYWYYQVDLLSTQSLTTDDYRLAALVLREAGYSDASYASWNGLQFDLPHPLQVEHRMRLKSES